MPGRDVVVIVHGHARAVRAAVAQVHGAGDVIVGEVADRQGVDEDEVELAGGALAQPAAEGRGGDVALGAEDPVLACGRERTGECGQADDQQGFGRGLLDWLAEYVDEHRYREDRATGADEAEQDADRESERDREQRVVHLDLVSVAGDQFDALGAQVLDAAAADVHEVPDAAASQQRHCERAAVPG